MIDFSAIVARAQIAASQQNLVPVKRNASTGRMVVTKVATSGKVTPVAPVAPTRMTANGAREFLAAIRVAGRRPNDKGIMVSAGDNVKIADEKAALVAFVGKAESPHGNAMFQATSTARQLIAREYGAPVAPVKVASTVRGYVAGVAEAGKREADDAAARRRVAVGLVLDLRKIATREGLQIALLNAGHDDAKFAPFLASDAEAVEAAKLLADKLAAEHGIAE